MLTEKTFKKICIAEIACGEIQVPRIHEFLKINYMQSRSAFVKIIILKFLDTFFDSNSKFERDNTYFLTKVAN